MTPTKMVKTITKFPLYFPTLLFLLPLHSYAMSPLHTYIHGSCSPTRHVSNHHITALLTTLLNSTTNSTFQHITLTAANDVVLHSLYQCRGDLSPQNCTSCVAHSISLLSSTCPLSSSATLQLQGCYVAYTTNASFWNVHETNVVYKRFAGSGIGGRYVEREKVLNGLVVSGNSSGSFRTVGSNGLLGQAQCIEQLSIDRCQGCLQTAVKLLKTNSGDSGNGDVFLAKCYARYSYNNGYSGYAYGHRSSDDGVKTFALIAGSLAGIVVVIVFLTFVCREFAGSSV